MCEVENFIDKDGKQSKFYNGPSPDEVALVEFASAIGFDCIQSEKSYVKMKAKLENEPKEYSYQIYRKMDFNSDRKRMSLLLKDPMDGKIKLLIKGADSIIMERLDQSQLPQIEKDRTDWFLNTASKQGLRTLLMAMRIIEEHELEEFLEEC